MMHSIYKYHMKCEHVSLEHHLLLICNKPRNMKMLNNFCFFFMIPYGMRFLGTSATHAWDRNNTQPEDVGFSWLAIDSIQQNLSWWAYLRRPFSFLQKIVQLHLEKLVLVRKLELSTKWMGHQTALRICLPS
jgi:hypothetical protein